HIYLLGPAQRLGNVGGQRHVSAHSTLSPSGPGREKPGARKPLDHGERAGACCRLRGRSDMSRIARSVALLLALLMPVPAWAVFHVSVIDEFMSGVGGDSTVQYVEIRMLLGSQNQVARTK